MNLLHLKYAVEVERTRSISKAAQALYMGQPNLSRAIKDLEESLGITIFNRTSRGITPTPQGEQFLARAKSILSQIDEVEALYRRERDNKIKFSAAVVRASYIAQAFARFTLELESGRGFELGCRETDSMRAIESVLHSECRLAVVRCRRENEKNFKELLSEKDLDALELWEFERLLLMSREHPLANEERIVRGRLADYIQTVFSDCESDLSFNADMRTQPDSTAGRRVIVCGRAELTDFLELNPMAYAWTSPQPQRVLKAHGLTQRRCSDSHEVCKDFIVCKSRSKLSDIDMAFVRELEKSRDEVAAVPTV